MPAKCWNGLSRWDMEFSPLEVLKTQQYEALNNLICLCTWNQI